MTKPIDVNFAPSPPSDFRWTIERYHHAISSGTLTEKDKVELLYGKIIDKMPAASPHAYAVGLIGKLLRRRIEDNLDVREEKPVTFPKTESELAPDVVVVADMDYSRHHPHPKQISLLVEVASTSLSQDRGYKLVAYAQANVTEYWILNLIERQLEIYKTPLPSVGAYSTIIFYSEDETCEHEDLGPIPVASLLPTKKG